MKTLQYEIRFLTPAFLGNAEQNGQWRTPPFKALLRQWWRVANAARHGFKVTVKTMLGEEDRLFGSAAGDQGIKSLIRIRLDRWDDGKLRSWDGLEQSKVRHPEVQRTNYFVGPHAYLGFGPLDGRGNTKLSESPTTHKPRAAIQAGDSATLSIAFPDAHAPLIETALALMHLYGTLGGRSRNGWGSFALSPVNGTPALQETLDWSLLRSWTDALHLDWPHAIGRDQKGSLIWQTEPISDWKALMKRLAELKIGLRTQFPITAGKNAPRPEARHWLSYPVTNHNVASWRERGKGDLRLPNSLRFKVRKGADGKLRGVIFHIPCLPPPTFRPDQGAIQQVWQRVHAFLDNPLQKLTRIPA